ncbi:MAG: AraC family transcriptional regulator [Bacillota bacterium]|nr:AraC family transcriptional regulator [Bacillota bacterium]
MMGNDIKIKKVNINNEDMTPKVLTAAVFSQGATMPEGFRLPGRYVYDYEFELIIYSKGSMIIDNEHYNVNQGDILFRKPGQYTQGIMPYSCYLICVDMLNNTDKNPNGYYIYNEQNFQNYYVNPILEKLPTIFHPLNTERSSQIFDSIFKEFVTPSPVSELFLRANILNLMYYLYQDSTNPFLNNTVALSPHFNSLKVVIDHIEKNIDKKIVLNDLSKMANMSPNHFHKIFTKTMGITPNDYIIKHKLDKAKKLLTRTSSSVSEISNRCGFENAPYFSFVFKKLTTMTPIEFRRKHSYI